MSALPGVPEEALPVESTVKGPKSRAKKPPKGESAQWTYSDTKNFLEFLASHRSEMGEGFSFKSRTFNAAAEHMSQFTTVGGAKDAAACRSKWQEVCTLCLLTIAIYRLRSRA